MVDKSQPEEHEDFGQGMRGTEMVKKEKVGTKIYCLFYPKRIVVLPRSHDIACNSSKEKIAHLSSS